MERHLSPAAPVLKGWRGNALVMPSLSGVAGHSHQKNVETTVEFMYNVSLMDSTQKNCNNPLVKSAAASHSQRSSGIQQKPSAAFYCQMIHRT